MVTMADKAPAEDDLPEDRQKRLDIYRKIVVLSCVPCCGMCGTMRLASKPFWCLNMRLCKHCVEANLISNLVLYERFWVTLSKPVQGHATFVNAIAGNVFYFNNHLTPLQRLDFSSDKIDFPGGARTIWWFWRPHLEKCLDMELLAKEAALKHRAAESVVAIVRRALTLRILSGAKDKSVPTTLARQGWRKRDMRSALFKLKRIELLDRIDGYHEQRLLMRLNPLLAATLRMNEDRVIPQVLYTA
jgi:hypothetical protein